MNYIALNGFQHPLNSYFNSNVTCINTFNWTRSNATELARSITVPTTVIGFSDGATAAITIGNYNPLVVKVYAHSPMFRQEQIRDGIDLTLFRTVGDSTPTFHQTRLVYENYKLSDVPHHIQLLDLRALPHVPVRNLATFIMKIRRHQFHNCLPYLPQEIIKHETHIHN